MMEKSLTSTTLTSESSEEDVLSDEEIAFKEYVKDGQYDPVTDAYFRTFGFSRD